MLRTIFKVFWEVLGIEKHMEVLLFRKSKVDLQHHNLHMIAKA